VKKTFTQDKVLTLRTTEDLRSFVETLSKDRDTGLSQIIRELLDSAQEKQFVAMGRLGIKVERLEQRVAEELYRTKLFAAVGESFITLFYMQRPEREDSEMVNKKLKELPAKIEAFSALVSDVLANKGPLFETLTRELRNQEKKT